MLPPVEWITVKQPKGSRVCVACVTAMAIGKSLAYVKRRMRATKSDNGQPFYRTREMLRVLGGHGIHYGMFVVVHGRLRKEDRLQFDSPLEGRPAVCGVPSQNIPGAMHVVFWDGQFIRDPDPTLPDTTSIEEYEIKDMVPLIYLDERLEDEQALIRANGGSS